VGLADRDVAHFVAEAEPVGAVDVAGEVGPAVPRDAGWFGFLCWALAAYLGWVTVSRGGERQGPALPLRRHPASSGLTKSPTEAAEPGPRGGTGEWASLSRLRLRSRSSHADGPGQLSSSRTRGMTW
jgi:hypothetical protein